MHLKNVSLITRRDKIELALAYDLLSTTVAYLALGRSLDDIVEIALPLKGRKKGLTASAWLNYFARKRLELTDKVVDGILNRFRQAVSKWHETIEASFLPAEQRALYTQLINKRLETLDLCE